MDLPAPAASEEARRVYCVYPISGSYTSSQRYLLCLTTALALLGHSHEWLTAACFSFTVSYSSAAAAHAIALAFQADIHHDGDIFAVDLIVQWASYASIVCALFCPRLLGRSVSQLAWAWSLLLVASRLALAVSCPRLFRDVAGSLVLSRRGEGGRWSDPCAGLEVRTMFRGYPGDSMRPVVWDRVGVADDGALPQPAGDDGDIIPWPEVVRAAEVVSYMALQSLKNSLLLAPSIQTLTADRRDYRDVVFVRLLGKRVPRPTSSQKRSDLLPAVVIMRFLQLHWFLVQCFPMLMVVDFPVRLAARILHRYFKFRKLGFRDVSFLEPAISQRRYQAARLAAMSFYALTTLGYVTWIPAAASFATDGAYLLAKIPESETFRAVGQWSPWLTLSLAVAAALATRLLGTDQTVGTMGSWIRQHRMRLLYGQVRNWLATEWAGTKEWWGQPEKQAIAFLRTLDEEDEDAFPSRMLQELEDFSRERAGLLLPLPVPRQLDEQLRGQDDLSVYGIDVVDSTNPRSTSRKGKGKERQE